MNSSKQVARTVLLATGVFASGLALADDDYEHAKVVDVEPLVREIRSSVPRRECTVETVYERSGGYGGERPAAGQMILGGLLGAVIGHEIGDGRGRRNATIAGAVIGTAIGHDMAQNRRDNRYGERTVSVPVEREHCRTRYEDRYEQQITGYRVTYRYNGRLYTTNMPYDPGDRIQVRVSVAPVRGAG